MTPGASRARRRPSLWRTFGVKLNLWYLLLFAGALAAGSVVADDITRDAVAHAHERAVQDALATLRTRYAQGGLAGLGAATTVTTRREFIYVRVVDEHARAVYERRPERGPLPEAPPPGRGATGRAEDAGANWKIATVKVTEDRYLQVGLRDDDARATLDVLRRAFLVVIAVAMGIAVLGGALLTWRARRPLKALRETAAQIIDSGDLTPRVPVSGRGDELDALSELYNRLLDHNQRLIEAMHGALDAVAHDLRTPLTRLRGRAELPLADPRLSDVGRDALADCVEESDRVLGMLSTLMDITEAEAGAMSLRREAVNLAAVGEEVADIYELVAEDAGVELRVEVPLTLSIRADRVRLRQAIANLVDNALKFTPAEGLVTVSAEPVEGGVEITVSDTGPGIPPGDEARIWRRLYRADVARSKPGLGLGLALVKAVVEAHGGRVAASRAPGGGARMTLWLPDAGPH